MDYTTEQLKYPIGKYHAPQFITEQHISEWIDQIADLPYKLRIAVSELTDGQLNTPYREHGWTLRQVVHHLPDSHINAYIRFKLAITEDIPPIRPYFEDRWAECEEARTAPVSVSLNLLDSLHNRWVLFMRSLNFEDFDRSYFHPEHNKTFTLKEITGMYAWHGEHHLQHVLFACKRNGWHIS